MSGIPEAYPAGMEAHTAAGISLSGLSKTFRGPNGPVHAVRDVDVEIEHGETVALLGPNGAGKSTTIDMMLGLLPPDAGTVSLFGRDPHEAIAAGAVGAMLQTGELIRDLSVRELIAMIASLYPAPLDGRRRARDTGLGDVADQRTQKLSGGADPARALRHRARRQPGAAGARRADGGDGRRGAARRSGPRCASSPSRGTTVVFATHYLEEADAYADRAMLMARGRIVADGPTTEIKAHGRLAHDPGDAARRLRRRRSRALPGVASADRRGEAVDPQLRRLRRRHPRPAGRVPHGARHRDLRRRPRAGVPAADRRRPRRRRHERRMAATYTRFELLRTFRNRRFFIFSLGFPLVAVLPHRRPQPRRATTSPARGSRRRSTTWSAWSSFGTMSAMLSSGARIAAERARGLEPPAAHHPADAARVLPRQGRDRLPAWPG